MKKPVPSAKLDNLVSNMKFIRSRPQLHVLAFILIFSSFSHAGDWSEKDVISSVGVSAGYIIISGNHDPGNPDGCGQGLPLVVDKDRADYSEIYALLVASFLQGKQVEIYVQGCINYSGQTRPRITAVNSY